MNYKDYEQKLIEELKKINRNARIIISPVIRNNGEEQAALIILPEGEICSPEIFLSSIYGHFCRNHLTVRQSAEFVMNLYNNIRESMNENCQLEEDLIDFEKIEDHLTIKIINREWNTKLLEEVVNIPFLDLAGMFYIANSLETMTAGIKVTRELKTLWGVSLETLLNTALRNLSLHGHFKMREIREVLSEISEYRVSHEKSSTPGLYVVTDISRRNGPAVLLLPEVMKEMADELEDDLLFLPSSVNELIVLRAQHADIPDLKRIVREINDTVVEKQEILGNGVYRFHRHSSELSVA